MLTELVAIRDRIPIKPVLLTLAAFAVIATVAVPASASAATTSAPTLAQGAGMGSKPSAAVRSVQRVLRQRGYDLGRPGVDGRFGPLTAGAVRHLQSDYGLAVDGIVGAKTRKLVRLLQGRTQRTSAGRQKSSTNKRPAPAPSSTAPAPAPRPVPVAPAAQGNDNGSLMLIVALAALAAFAVALWPLLRTSTRRRRVAAPAVTPIARELYLEGRSDDPRVGEFRGHALAVTIPERPGEQPAPERTSYLVDDVRKQAPVWVLGSEVERSTSRLAAGSPVIGYVTVSADAARADADEPARLIEEACVRSDWELVEVVTDRENGGMLDRPGLSYALEQIAEGRAGGLVVSDMRRLSRSIVDLGALMEWFRDAHAALIALDLGVDTSTPGGHELAATLITLGDWERERIANRTRSGLAAVRASGRSTGRPAVSDRPHLVERITAMRAANMTLQAIADQLNAEGVPTLRGGMMWRPSSVQAALGYRRPGTRSPRDQLPPLEGRS
jgi:DNA invertase Pin-like site-specific DNA recombinase/peptidoglycan hydrolase-like protein with peptidoglycan-binding domain